MEITRPATAIPLPSPWALFALPRPTPPKIIPRIAGIRAKRLMQGIKESTADTIPSTSADTGIASVLLEATMYCSKRSNASQAFAYSAYPGGFSVSFRCEEYTCRGTVAAHEFQGGAEEIILAGWN